MATAGLSREELDISAQDDMLIVTGPTFETDEGDKRDFIHRGIAKRAFERRFQLSDTIKVTRANHADRLLDTKFVHEVPEHKKPRRIVIGGTDVQAVTIDMPASCSEAAHVAFDHDNDVPLAGYGKGIRV